MKVITEALIRAELKATTPEVYYIPEGKILSPAAKEYLQQEKIDIDFQRNRTKREAAKITKDKPSEAATTDFLNDLKADSPMKYTDYESGAGYLTKPEHMTQLFGNQLVEKSHPRIVFRGKLDRVQSDIVYAQAVIFATGKDCGVVKDLNEILDVLREMMRCEVLDESFTRDSLLGMSNDELRARSHNPGKYYNIESMLLPDYSMGVTYSLLNLLRASVRELEVAAVVAFKNGRNMERSDVLQGLNRLSSAVHIMMCKYLAHEYDTK